VQYKFEQDNQAHGALIVDINKQIVYTLLAIVLFKHHRNPLVSAAYCFINKKKTLGKYKTLTYVFI